MKCDTRRIGCMAVPTATPETTPVRPQALRELVIDASRHKPADAALALTRELLQQTNSTFSDRLLLLDVLREWGLI